MPAAKPRPFYCGFGLVLFGLLSTVHAKPLTGTALKLIHESLKTNAPLSSQDLIRQAVQQTGESAETLRGQWLDALDSLDTARRQNAPLWRQITGQTTQFDPRQADRFLRRLMEESTRILGKKGDYPLDPVIEKAARKAKILPFQGRDYLVRLLAQDPVPAPASAAAASVPKGRQSQQQAGKFLLDGRSSYHAYDPDNLRALLTGDQARDSHLAQFFGTIDHRFVHAQISDLHRPILTALAQQAAASPLWHDPMIGSYRLSFIIFRLDFWTQLLGRENQVFCVAQIGVQAHRLPADEPVFEQTPPLFIRIPKDQPGGRQTLRPLHMLAAEQIWQAFQNHLLDLPPSASP